MSGNIATGKVLSGKNIWTVLQTGVVSQNIVWKTVWVWGTGLLIIGILCGLIIGRLIAKVLYLQNRSNDRKLSVQQSKATTLGYVTEKIAPLLPQFPYNHKDLVFLGKGVDYLCFDGLSKGELKQVVFIEIKTGQSQLNKNEQAIKNVIEKGRVKWETMRM
jgi:hypothetical protein